MNDSEKTKKQLIAELQKLRLELAEYKTARSDLQRSETALKESESKYRKLFDHAGDAILLSDKLQFLDCNNQALRMFRCSKEQLKPVIAYGNTFSPPVQPDGSDSKQKAVTAIEAAFNGEPQNLEWRYRRYDGTLFDAEVTLTRIIIEDKKLLLSIIRDVTKRKFAEQEVRKSRKLFQDLVENSPSGIFIFQHDRLVYVNPELERLLGAPVPPTFRLTTYEGIYPDDTEKVKELHQRIRSGDMKPYEMILRFYPFGKTGSKPDLKVVYCRTCLIEYEDRNAVLLNMIDITRARELEQLLQARDKMTSLGRIAAGIAHEIRNPLSGININLSSLAKIVRSTNHSDEALEIIDELQQSSRKIEDVIKRVMDFSRPSEPHFKPADINQPVREAVKLTGVTIRKNNIRIETDLSDDMALCSIDHRLIEQVIVNLINNASGAIRESGGDGIIRITTVSIDGHVLVHVDDTGPGVPKEVREKVFYPFFTTRTDGAGIGLSISNRIITDHGGSLIVEDGPLGGARFTIELPLPKGDRT